MNILAVIFGLAAILSMVLFMLFGRDKKVCPTVEVRPPDEMTPIEASFILDGHIETADITSIIIYWANNGFLSINNICKIGRDEIEFIKLKDSDASMKPYEKLLFDKIFNGRSNIALVDLNGKLHIRLRKVKFELAHMFKSPSTRLFTNASTITTIICSLLAGLCTGVISGVAAAIYNFDTSPGVICGISVFIVTVCLCVSLKFFVHKAASGKKFGVILCMIIYISLLLIISNNIYMTGGLKVAAVTSAASSAVCCFAATFSKRHSKQGRDWLGKLLGLKHFITIVEKGRIEMLVEKNSSLFYDILPFACTFGVVYEWTMQFENIPIANPSWYKSNTRGMFNPIYFKNLMNGSMANYQNGEISVALSSYAAGRGFRSGGRTNGPR
jgi:uncharacterized membrane protein (UPF0136 family)